MDVAEAVFLLIIMGAINHQITHIITTGVIFKEMREWVWKTFGGKLGYLTTCHLCCGTWVGYGMALFVYQDLPLTENPMVDYLFVSFAISFIGRMWNEVWALASSKVAEIRAREACGACA